MTLTSDAPGSLFGELEKIARDPGHHSHLAHELPHCRFFPCTLPCSPKVHDVDRYLQVIGYCKPVFGGTVVRCSFSGISSIPVRPFTTLGGSCYQPLTCSVGTAGKREVSRVPHCNPEGIQLTDGLGLLATHHVKNVSLVR